MRGGNRQSITVAFGGLAGGILVYLLVAGSQPLYESESVLYTPSLALLAEFDRVTAPQLNATRRVETPTLDRRDLGDVGAIADAVRRRLGSRADSGTIEVAVDSLAREVSITTRHHVPSVSRDLVNGVAQGIITRRYELLSKRLGDARASLALLTVLGAPSRAAQARVHALHDRISGLVQLRSSGGGGLSALRRADTPTEPVSPRKVRDAIVGALVAMLVAVTVQSLDRSVRTKLRNRGAPSRNKRQVSA